MVNQTNVGSTTKKERKGSYTVSMGAFDMEDNIEIVLPPDKAKSFNADRSDYTFTLTTATDYNKILDRKGNVVKRVSKSGKVLSDDTLKGQEH